jgi:seryl-tRNA synthetase
MAKSSAPEVDTIVQEAREGFDLRARLAGTSKREKTVTIYTDADTGSKLGGAEDIVLPGTEIVSGRRRWGVQGQLDEISQRAEALAKQITDGKVSDEEAGDEIATLETKRAELTKQAEKLLKKLDESALVFTLQAVPDLVVRDSRRIARKNLGIKAKGIEGREEEFSLEYTAVLLAASVASWTDKLSGDTFDELSVDQAKQLRDFLPVGQFSKLDRAMVELSMEAAIGNYGTDSADF